VNLPESKHFELKVVIKLSLLAGRYAVCRLERQAPLPAWAMKQAFCSVTRTADELSIVCAESDVPDGILCEPNWRMLKLEGPFDFNLVGVLLAVIQPLAEKGVSIFAVSTYDTDYVLVHEPQLEQAVTALTERGHQVTIIG
jgi:hypothetical protein